MLKNLKLVNFKSSRDLDIPLKPLTVLSGLNGSGKSTVLQALGLIMQNLPHEFYEDITHFHLHGSIVRLGSLGHVLSDHSDEGSIRIEITDDSGDCGIWESDPNVEPDADIVALKKTANIGGMILFELMHKHFQFLQADRLTPQTIYDKSNSVSRNKSFLGVHGEFTPDFLATQGDTLNVPERRQCPLSIPGLSSELGSRIDSTPKLFSQIGRWLQHVSPGVRISAKHLDDTDSIRLAFSYASTGVGRDSPSRRPSHVGFGLTYSLPIVTACLAAPKDALLLLENPEAHLHPRGQMAMGLLLAKCAADGVQIILETHSDHVLNGIRLAVKSSESGINADDVQICNFSRDPLTGDSFIESPLVLPNGDLSSWPEGFFDEWEKSLEALLR